MKYRRRDIDDLNYRITLKCDSRLVNSAFKFKSDRTVMNTNPEASRYGLRHGVFSDIADSPNFQSHLSHTTQDLMYGRWVIIHLKLAHRISPDLKEGHICPDHVRPLSSFGIYFTVTHSSSQNEVMLILLSFVVNFIHSLGYFTGTMTIANRSVEPKASW